VHKKFLKRKKCWINIVQKLIKRVFLFGSLPLGSFLIFRQVVWYRCIGQSLLSQHISPYYLLFYSSTILDRNMDTLFRVLHCHNNYNWFAHLVKHPWRESRYELQIQMQSKMLTLIRIISSLCMFTAPASCSWRKLGSVWDISRCGSRVNCTKCQH